MDPGTCPRDVSMCGRVFLSGETTVVPDASRDPLFQDNPFVTGQLDSIRFYASVPLTTASGFVLGSLCVFSPAPAELPPDKKAALEIIASQAVGVLELQHHARMLARSLEEARNSNELLESFAGRISHDLRNPLTSIIGFTELGELQSNEETEELRVIGRTSRRMLSMLDDILSFSRIGGTLRLREVSLAALVRDVEEDLAAQLGETGAEIQVSDFVVYADADQLRALLQNLIHNAVTYCRPGIMPKVLVSAEAVDDVVNLRVTDNGKGIPAGKRARVTEPLVRLHRDDDPPGSGLGLATCARIAEAHGGQLKISSGPDGGTTVSVTIPAAPPED
jgi:signal transduction histidine kinase